jgi:murein DD-endopeptidase MepM/ murein hydrolase activator NlpD
VRTGERIGAVGCTGSCWGDHLHIEMRRGRGTTGRPLDPLPQLRRLAQR